MAFEATTSSLRGSGNEAMSSEAAESQELREDE